MRLPRFRYVILIAVVAGGVLPFLIIEGLWLHILPSFPGERLFCFWPSVVLLMAMEPGHTAQAYTVLGMSIGINILLYLVVFTVLWSFGWIFCRWRASLRDGTTI
jgi:hypothetical protein